jgi:hypothetical protein
MSTGSTVETQDLYYDGFIVKPSLLKGSTLVHNGSYFDILPLGSTGTVYTASSADALGIQWSSISGRTSFYGDCYASSTGAALSYTIANSATPGIVNITSTTNMVSSNVTHTSPFKLTYTGSATKDFMVLGLASTTINSGTAIYIVKNSTVSMQSFSTFQSTTTSVPMTFVIISLSQNDFVELYMGNTSGPTTANFYNVRLLMYSLN